MTRPIPNRPSIRRRLFGFGIAIGAAAALSTAPILAQDTAAPAAPAPEAAAAAPETAPPDPKAVVATVGDQTITEADLGFAAEDLGQELSNVPPDQRRAFLLTVLIDMKVMAKAARDASMDQSEVYKQRLGYLEDRALRRAYFTERIANSVTPDAVKAAYDDYVKTFVPQEEVRASHILVATEADAKAIEEELKKGASFEQIAKEKSMDPSGAKTGGDLGYFTRGMMVKPFEDAAFALDVGQISDPVQSQFGWHIIKVVDKKQTAAPAFEQVAPQLQQQILFKVFDETVGALKQNLEVDIPDATLAEQVKQQSQAPVPE
jgi:peptidyl-prolyl cis-trans isomerase C